MKSTLKKIYYRLAAPLWQKIITHFDTFAASETAARSALSDESERLKIEVAELKSMVAEQNRYLNGLRGAGLHDMLAQHSQTELQLPATVITAVTDVTNGMEPSLASSIHKISSDTIISWVDLFSEQVRDANLIVKRDSFSEVQSGEEVHDGVALLERQLEFNEKNHLDRERAASLEIARLKKLVQLAEPRSGLAVTDK